MGDETRESASPEVIARPRNTFPTKWLDEIEARRVLAGKPHVDVRISLVGDDDIGEVTVLTANGPIKEMPTSICADEILMEGDGQIKALICVGGNPLLAWPGQEKSFKALKKQLIRLVEK